MLLNHLHDISRTNLLEDEVYSVSYPLRLLAWRNSNLRICDCKRIILDHRVRQQSLTHIVHQPHSFFRAGGLQGDLQMLARAHGLYAVIPQVAQGVADGKAGWVID